MWIGGTLSATAIATLNAFVLSRPLSTTGEIVVGLIFTWITVGTAIIAFRYGKWGPNIGTFVKVAVVGIFTALFIAFLVKHGHPAHTSSVADLKLSVAGFLGVVGVLGFLWVVIELSNGASEEMHNPTRDVTRLVVVSGISATLLYHLTLLAIPC